MSLRNIVSSILVIPIIICVSLPGHGEEAAGACSSGYAWSEADGRCLACNRPCKTAYLGQCRHGIINCELDPAGCVSTVLPGERAERCDGVDNDCDGQIDEGFDRDADGYTTCGGDCDDRNPAIFPDSPERCDGVDNDCDGHIDEAFRVGRPCDAGVGSCRRKGVWRCRDDGSGSVCEAEAGAPSSEVCDGIDNDCDGAIDEDLGEIRCGVGACMVSQAACKNGAPARCVASEPGVELCGDGIDNDCDGAVDEGFEKLGKSCTMGEGACRRVGRYVCDDLKQAVICDAHAGAPSEELCGNRVDDDCDGTIDNAKDLDEPCDNGLLGACRVEGRRICNRSTGAVVCSARTVSPVEERCDGVDNDCDGEIDESLSEERACGLGVCAGGSQSRTCADGVWTEWSACTTAGKTSTEICDGIDNDCDGSMDDGVVERRACGIGMCDGGTQERRCTAGAWGAWSPCSTDIRIGAEVCDGKDNDCDGAVDEDVTNACGGCSTLSGVPGENCIREGGDDCGTGVYACRDDAPGMLICRPQFERSEGSECAADDNVCTIDVCRGGVCVHRPVTDGASCDDANACTIDDLCVDGACVGGARGICDDDNPCTTDSCEPDRGCVHAAVGDGQPNECGGCGALAARPGERCLVDGARGPCMHGINHCMPSGSLSCVQQYFPLEEICNSVDDDCDGSVDEDLGELACGTGACRVAIARCRDGELDVCIPREPGLEDCTNMGSDDDCNGIVDDVPGLGSRCAVAVGTCVVPGVRHCGDGGTLQCVPADPSHAADADADGLANYCETDEAARRAGTIAGVKGRHLFDEQRTRAFMMPWNDIVGAASGAQQVLAIVGTDGAHMGLAGVTRAMAASDMIHVRPCALPHDMRVRAVAMGRTRLALGYGQGIALIDDPLDAFGVAESPDAPCAFDTEHSIALRNRPDDACQEMSIESLAFQGRDKNRLVWAARCRRESDARTARTSVFINAADVSQVAGGGEVAQVSELTARRSIERVNIAVSDVGTSNPCIVTAMLDGKVVALWCDAKEGRTSCEKEDLDIDAPLVFVTFAYAKDGQGRALALDRRGRAYWLQKGRKPIAAGGVPPDDADGSVRGAAVIKRGNGTSDAIALARESVITVLAPTGAKEGATQFVPVEDERYGPNAVRDAVSSGDRTMLSRPHALTPVSLSASGGPGLFAAYDIGAGGTTIGSMGFLYYRFNEAPQGGIRDVSFDGRRGRAKLAFADPTGDPLEVDVRIIASHGGLLEHWIDAKEDGVLAFSVRGDPAAVGLWPITIRATARDPSGIGVISTAVLARDGSIESIREVALEGTKQ